MAMAMSEEPFLRLEVEVGEDGEEEFIFIPELLSGTKLSTATDSSEIVGLDKRGSGGLDCG